MQAYNAVKVVGEFSWMFCCVVVVIDLLETDEMKTEIHSSFPRETKS